MLPAQDILRRARAARYADGGAVDPASVHLTAQPLYAKYREDAEVNGDPNILTYPEWLAQQQGGAAQVGGSTPTTTAPSASSPGLFERIRARLMGRADGGPVNAQLMGPLNAGDSANRLDAVRAMLAKMGGGAVQHYADGGTVHHVDPYTEGGFMHETGDNTYSYADGGMVPPMGPRAPIIPPGAAAPGGAPPGPASPIGALAQMGQELLKQQQALGQAYNIPSGGGAAAPMGTPGGGPPMGPAPGTGLPPGGGLPGGAASAGAVPPSPQLLAALQARLGPRRLAAGGPISGGLMKMALRNPGVMHKYCGGGMAYADGGAVSPPRFYSNTPAPAGFAQDALRQANFPRLSPAEMLNVIRSKR